MCLPKIMKALLTPGLEIYICPYKKLACNCACVKILLKNNYYLSI